MSQEKPLTGKQEAAAVLVADDALTNEQIAAEVGVSRRQVDRWRTQPQFQARVQQHIDDAARNLQKYAIARKDRRIAAMNKRWLALHRVIDERAEDGSMPADLPGVDTGHIIRTLKGKDGDAEEYVVDTGLLAELRALEKQAAQEAGQWTEKTDVTSNGESLAVLMAKPVTVSYLPPSDE